MGVCLEAGGTMQVMHVLLMRPVSLLIDLFSRYVTGLTLREEVGVQYILSLSTN